MKRIVLAVLALVLMTTCAWASGYNYISPEELKTHLDSNTPMTIVDICVLDQFNAGHIEGAIGTTAYPVKSETDKAKLAAVTDKLADNNDPVIIVCPRGKGGAKRTVDYYKAQGISESRLLILEDGADGWPYETVQ